jgi:hypothetical protein
MKNILISLLACFSLSACSFPWVKPDQDKPIVVKYKYIVTTIPDTMLMIPPKVDKVDPFSITDKDAAKWLIDSEVRSSTIESQLKAIKTYQDEKLKSLSYPPEDIIRN